MKPNIDLFTAADGAKEISCSPMTVKRIAADCPLRTQCVSAGQSHRTLVVGEFHSLLQARRQEQQTEAFKHQRNGIEDTQSELVRGYGVRQARYRGQAKVRLQNYLIGAAGNIRRLFRRIAWETAQTCRGVAPVTHPAVAD